MSSESTRTRTYRKKARAEQEERTRERITKAAVKLHGSVGPAQTTISAVAQEAGVQRGTVYRHFPTEADLYEACSAHFWKDHPLPDPGEWAAIRDPGKRLHRALADLYGLYDETEEMFEKTGRDAPLIAAMAGPMARFEGYLDMSAETIIRGRPERGAARRRVQAAIGHAILFPTWQSLVRRQGLEQREAVAVMVAMVASAGGARAG